MKAYKKRDFPVEDVRSFLEPGPIVLVSSLYKGRRNIMTMGWHTVLEFSPSLIGCMITSGNYSHDLIRKSRECVINVPTKDMTDKVVRIGNSTGSEIDKFDAFDLMAAKSSKVKAPLIKECYANFECKLYDAALVKEYNFFIFKVVKAHVATAPKYPQTIHYRGQGIFMESGRNFSRKSLFLPEML